MYKYFLFMELFPVIWKMLEKLTQKRKWEQNRLTLQYLVSTKSSHILKETCSWELQVYLRMCDLLVDTKQ